MSSVAAARVAPRRRPRRIRLLSANVERNVGVLFLLALCAAFVVVPLVSAYPVDGFVGVANQGPSTSHLFGTDTLGRDVFTRAFAGGRNDVIIAALAATASFAIGTTIGVLIGLTRRRLVAEVALRIIDAVLAIPFVILILSLIIVLGSNTRILGLPPGVGTVVVAIALVDWAVYARLARTQTFAVRDREFVVAARLLKYSHRRIVFRHVVPNVIATTASYAATDAILIIIGTASLAFLGSGIQEPTPELGNMMFEGHNYLATAWWITVLPGALVVLLGVSLALIADSFSSDD
jgi:peptide/nickel transport system permease protein